MMTKVHITREDFIAHLLADKPINVRSITDLYRLLSDLVKYDLIKILTISLSLKRYGLFFRKTSAKIHIELESSMEFHVKWGNRKTSYITIKHLSGFANYMPIPPGPFSIEHHDKYAKFLVNIFSPLIQNTVDNNIRLVYNNKECSVEYFKKKMESIRGIDK